MNERQNRTIICSVLFLDMVEYSRSPVSEQMSLKDRFNTLLFEAMKGVAPNDRIVLDTGDGAAVSFLGDPEDALFMALTLRDSLSEASQGPASTLRLRYGINLGPVKLVKDLNGRPNIIGDGINVAQRIMSFSTPGQVLVSRSYYEVVSRLSDEYAQLFQYEGSRTDKHVREHEVYGVTAGSPIPAKSPGARRTARLGAGDRAKAVLRLLGDSAMRTWGRLRQQPRVATVAAMALILAAAVAVRLNREVPYAAVAVAPTPSPAPGGEVRNAQSAAPSEAAQTQAAPAAPASAKGAPAAAGAAKAVEPSPTTKERNARNVATVSVAVLPWGEVYVDGVKRGVSPPLRTLQVTPGPHVIEIRNTTFPSHVERIDAKAEGQIKIKHNFPKGTAQ